MSAYFDYAASTPLDADAAEAATSAAAIAGNPSATHAFGRAARLALDSARCNVAGLLAAHEDEITFTSGATEANNLALLGFWASLTPAQRAGARLTVNPLEHASVLAAVKLMEVEGATVDWLTVGEEAVANVQGGEVIKPDTVLVICQWVNNVFGTVQPVAELGAAVLAERQRRGASGRPLHYHVDAVQAARFIELRPAAAGADSLALSAHKLYGPKGVGSLWLRRGAKVSPRAIGGGQESGRRAGTENVAGAVAFGVAARLTNGRRDEEVAKDRELATVLLSGLEKGGSSLSVIGDRRHAVPGIVALKLRRGSADRLAMLLDAEGLAVSTGSACDAGKREPSAAAKAVLGEKSVRTGFLRVSFGIGTTMEEMAILSEALCRLA
jgi:cysteine desulfurase